MKKRASHFKSLTYKNQGISLKTSFHICKTICRPMMEYGSFLLANQRSSAIEVSCVAEITALSMDLKGNLHSFSHYFTRYFEEQLLYWRHVLEESPELKAKPTSKHVSVISGMASMALPRLGKAISAGLKEGEKYFNKRMDMNTASDVASIAYTSDDTLRNSLIEGAYMVFSVYEYQFSKVTCQNGDVTRAMLKIAQDASNRLFTYLLNDLTITVITGDIVAKGILRGESKRHRTKMLKLGRTLNLIEDGSTITTSDFFMNCGICIKQNGIPIYYAKENHMPTLGHRLQFDFEDNIPTVGYSVVSPQYIHKYHFVNCDKQSEMKEIFQYIASKNPMEDLKEFTRFNFEEQFKLLEEATIERQAMLDKLLENNKSEQMETRETIESNQIAIMNHMDKVLTENSDFVISRTNEILLKHEKMVRDNEMSKMKDRTGERRQPIQPSGGALVVLSTEGLKTLGANVMKGRGQMVAKTVTKEVLKVGGGIRGLQNKMRKLRF